MKRNSIAGNVISFMLCLVLLTGLIQGTGMQVKADGSVTGEDNGKVYVGDVDGDGDITPKDVTAMRRYLAGGWDVEIDSEDGDVDQDGSITPKDVTMLRRYLAGGWGITLPEKNQNTLVLDALAKVGDIVFPCNKEWDYEEEYNTEISKSVGFYDSNRVVIDYLVKNVTQDECDEWLSSKEAFSKIAQKFIGDSSVPFEYDFFEEEGTWYGIVVMDLSGNTESSLVICYKLLDNILVESMIVDFENETDEKTLISIAKQTCILARKISETDSPCGYINTPNDHVWTETERQEPTITENGYVKYFCPNCGEIKTIILPATENNAGMYYDDQGLEQFVPWEKMIEDGIVTVEDNTITSTSAIRLKGKLIIKNGITGITEDISYENKLTSIYIPESLTSISSSTGSAFKYCYELTEIVVDSDNQVYDSRENCNAIIETATNTIVAACNTTTFPSSVETIGNYAFAPYTLESIEIPGTIMKIKSNMFGFTSTLKSIKLSEGLEYIDDSAFADIENLEEIVIPSTVTHIGSGAFGYDKNLKKIVVSSDNDTYYSGEDSDYIIEKGKRKLIFSLNAFIPDGTRVVGMNSISPLSLNADNTIDYLEIPASVEEIEPFGIVNFDIKHIHFMGNPPKIGNYNFITYDSDWNFVPIPGLIDVVVPYEYIDVYKELLPQFADKIIPDCEHEWVEAERVEPTEKNGYIKYICSKCEAVKTEVLVAANPEAGMYYQERYVERFMPWDELIAKGYITVVDNVITAADAYRISGNLRIQNGITGIEADFGIRYPLNTSRLKSVYIPESITSIKIDDQWRTPFAYCDNLEEIIVDPANLIYDSRNNCNAIIEKRSNTMVVGCKNSTIPDTVFEIGPGAFKGSGIEYVEIPGTVKNIRLGAFSGCSSLKKVKISEGVGLIDAVSFSGDDQLEEIEIPSSVYNIGVSNFSNNPKLKAIKVAEGNNYYKSIDDKVLMEISYGMLIISLDHTIPDGTRFFAPESMTSGIEITPSTVLDELVFPATVEEIGVHGVNRIDIKHLVFLGAPPTITGENFMAYDNTWVLAPLPSLVDIKVPDEYLEAYKELLPQFADKIIPDDGE